MRGQSDVKGVQDLIVCAVCSEIETWGYGGLHVILKLNQEPALVAFNESLQGYRCGESTLEESPVGQSASNGLIERSVCMFKDKIRTLNDGIESKLGGPLIRGSDALIWLVKWAGVSLSKYRVGKDNQTLFECLPVYH